MCACGYLCEWMVGCVFHRPVMINLSFQIPLASPSTQYHLHVQVYVTSPQGCALSFSDSGDIICVCVCVCGFHCARVCVFLRVCCPHCYNYKVVLLGHRGGRQRRGGRAGKGWESGRGGVITGQRYLE